MGLTVNALLLESDAAFLPLSPEDVLRTHNPPWTVILPGDDEHAQEHLMRIARAVTGPCLYFHYFDDDMFFLHLYVDGKRAASLSTHPEAGRTSHVERISWAFFGDDEITPALKLISKTVMLEEQLALAEEALGVSLTDHIDFEPRTVPRGTEVFTAVTARLKALKNRKNAYRPMLLDAGEIPPALLEEHPPAPRCTDIPGAQLTYETKHKGPNRIWLKNISDGSILHEAVVNGEIFDKVWWMPEYRQYVTFSRTVWVDGAGWKILCTQFDEHLTLLREVYLPPHTRLPGMLTRREGTTFWSGQWKDDRIQILDIADLSLRYVLPEDRVLFRGLPTAELVWGSKGDADIILFDRTGRLLSRHRFKGDHARLHTLDGVMYVLDEDLAGFRTPYGGPDVLRVWRLDKI